MDVTSVLEAVAAEYDIHPLEITSRTRRQPVALARQVVFYILRSTTSLTLSAIGEALGRHHATVIHGVNTIERLRTQDRVLDARIRRLVNNLTASAPEASSPQCAVCAVKGTPLRSSPGELSNRPSVNVPASQRALWSAALPSGMTGSLG